ASACAAATLAPSTSTILRRELAPATTRTSRGATPNAVAIAFTTASFAAPSTGAALTRSFSASPWSPPTPGDFARGCTWIVSLMPPAVCVTWSIARSPIDRRKDQPAQDRKREPGHQGRDIDHPHPGQHATQRPEEPLRESEGDAADPA